MAFLGAEVLAPTGVSNRTAGNHEGELGSESKITYMKLPSTFLQLNEGTEVNLTNVICLWSSLHVHPLQNSL